MQLNASHQCMSSYVVSYIIQLGNGIVPVTIDSWGVNALNMQLPSAAGVLNTVNPVKVVDSGFNLTDFLSKCNFSWHFIFLMNYFTNVTDALSYFISFILYLLFYIFYFIFYIFYILFYTNIIYIIRRINLIS